MNDNENPRNTSPLDQLEPSFTIADMKARADDLANSTVITREEMDEFRTLRHWIARLGDMSDDATFLIDEGRVLDGGQPVEIFGTPYRLYDDATPFLQVNKTISLTYAERALVAEAVENLIDQVTNPAEERLLAGVLDRLRGPGMAARRDEPEKAPAYPFPGGKP